MTPSVQDPRTEKKNQCGILGASAVETEEYKEIITSIMLHVASVVQLYRACRLTRPSIATEICSSKNIGGKLFFNPLYFYHWENESRLHPELFRNRRKQTATIVSPHHLMQRRLFVFFRDGKFWSGGCCPSARRNGTIVPWILQERRWACSILTAFWGCVFRRESS